MENWNLCRLCAAVYVWSSISLTLLTSCAPLLCLVWTYVTEHDNTSPPPFSFSHTQKYTHPLYLVVCLSMCPSLVLWCCHEGVGEFTLGRCENPKWLGVSACDCVRVCSLLHTFIYQCVYVRPLAYSTCAWEACVPVFLPLAHGFSFPGLPPLHVMLSARVTQWKPVTKYHLSITTHQLCLSVPLIEIYQRVAHTVYHCL